VINQDVSLSQLRILYLEHLLLTNDFIRLYTSLAEKFEGESCTLGELQKALESRFNELELRDLSYSQKESIRDEFNVDGLIERVKDNLTPQVSPKDGKSFLMMFTQALKGVLVAAEKAEKWVVYFLNGCILCLRAMNNSRCF
jgi:hypothetical protein